MKQNKKKKITKEEFYRLHKYCPKCGSDKLVTTLRGIIEDETKDFVDTNQVSCVNAGSFNLKGCGWSGVCSDLVKDKRKTIRRNYETIFN